MWLFKSVYWSNLGAYFVALVRWKGSRRAAWEEADDDWQGPLAGWFVGRLDGGFPCLQLDWRDTLGSRLAKLRGGRQKRGRTSEGAYERGKIESVVAAICSGVAPGVVIKTFKTSLVPSLVSLFLQGWSDTQQRAKTTKLSGCTACVCTFQHTQISWKT